MVFRLLWSSAKTLIYADVLNNHGTVFCSLMQQQSSVQRKAPQTAPVNIQGLDIEIVEEYKYLDVHTNNKLD